MKKFVCLLLSLLTAAMPVSAPGEGAGSYSDYEPLCGLAASYGFKLGGCLSYGQLNDPEYLDFLATHFNSVTMTNETKAYSLLSPASSASRDGTPIMNFAQADKMVEWARDNGLKVRGHVLVWDAYMTDWFFREKYNSKMPYADEETMRFRVKSYIEKVITHFETKYPGVIYCWDVVNEAIADGANEWVDGDPRHLRSSRGGTSNIFLDHVGSDYVEYAFLCARDTVDKLGADIKLFYNDYNMFFPEKRAAAIELVRSINSYAKDENGQYRKLVDGIGMQGYIGGYGTQQGCMNAANIASVRDSIKEYASLGLEVQITEMAVRNYDASKIDAHGTFYGNLFKTFRSINTDPENPALTAVCIWGLTDNPNLGKNDYSYKMNGPYCGLVTEKLAVKPAFENVYKVLKGE